MELGLGDSFYQYAPCNGKYTTNFIEKTIVEDNKEFFSLKTRELKVIQQEINECEKKLNVLREEESNHFYEFTMNFDNSYIKNFDNFNDNVDIDFSYPMQEMSGYVGYCKFKTLKSEYSSLDIFKEIVKKTYEKDKYESK